MDRKLASNSRWRERNKERVAVMKKAHNLLWVAIRNGLINRGEVCEQCGSAKDIEGAHLSYDEPLRVIWLCSPCHRSFDMKNPKSYIP